MERQIPHNFIAWVIIAALVGLVLRAGEFALHEDSLGVLDIVLALALLWGWIMLIVERRGVSRG